MKKEFRILFTGAGRRIELIQAYKQAALFLNITIKIYGAEMSNTAPALAYCDHTRMICSMRDSEYVSELLYICKKDKIDIVIPTIDTDLLVLSENKMLFENIGTRLLVSSPEMIKICRDKNNTSSFFEKCGLKAPKTCNDWTKYDEEFPAFIKPKDGSSSIDAYKVKNIEELESYAKKINGYVIQPFIDGFEYTVDVFCDFDGNPVSIVPRERVAVRSGEVLKTKICLDDVIIGEMLQLINAFKPCGPMTVQLIKDRKTGKNYYIEINPRYGGGAPLSMKAGARSAESLLRLLVGEKLEYQDSNIDNNVIYSRFDQSVCVSKKIAKGSVKGVIFDLDDTLYLEKDYVESGYNAVADYLGNKDFANVMLKCFLENKPAIDTLLLNIGRLDEKEQCLSVYRNHMPIISLDKTVTEVITQLKDYGIRLGIITDGRPVGQWNKIKALGLDKLIDDIIVTDELGGEQFRKPNDISFRIIQNRWKIPYEQIVYVGDNINKDFYAPNQLGMKSILLRNENGLYFSDENESEDMICIDKIADVLEYVYKG